VRSTFPVDQATINLERLAFSSRQSTSGNSGSIRTNGAPEGREVTRSLSLSLSLSAVWILLPDVCREDLRDAE
jgi:hypothetical protein